MSTNCTDEALSNDIIKNSFLFVITYLWSNIIQKSAQPHVPPQIKCILKDALSLFIRLKKDFEENEYLWDGKIYNFILGMPYFYNVKQLTKSHFNMKKYTNQNMLVTGSVAYYSYLSNYQKDVHYMEKF